jgi:hypothetical protein
MISGPFPTRGSAPADLGEDDFARTSRRPRDRGSTEGLGEGAKKTARCNGRGWRHVRVGMSGVAYDPAVGGPRSIGRSGSGASHMAVDSIQITDLKREEGAAGLC